MTPRERSHRYLPALIWSLVVAALLVAPGDTMPEPGSWEWLDKPVHALLFAIHSSLLARCLAPPMTARGALASAAVASACYALLLEAVQVWVPGRSWEWWDLGAGIAGIAVAALVVSASHARLRGTS